jgi:hypothetical protein
MDSLKRQEPITEAIGNGVSAPADEPAAKRVKLDSEVQKPDTEVKSVSEAPKADVAKAEDAAEKDPRSKRKGYAKIKAEYVVAFRLSGSEQTLTGFQVPYQCPWKKGD